MRKKIIAGNWKMNKTHQEGMAFSLHLFNLLDIEESLLEDSGKLFPEIIIAPSFLFLHDAVTLAQGWDVKIAAQNCSSEKIGAYTGEISAPMLKAINVDYVIIGHSERRTYFGETNQIVAEKINLALENNLSVICCIGETFAEREAGKEFQIVTQQIEECLFHLPVVSNQWSVLSGKTTTDNKQLTTNKIVIAYEPVWAIGTGKNATPQQAQEMHRYIRKIIAEKFGKEFSGNISIIYGGSCNPENAGSIFSQPDIDGGLIGGASLIAEDFVEVVKCAIK